MTIKKMKNIKHVPPTNWDMRVTLARKGIMDKGILGKLTTEEINIQNEFTTGVVMRAFKYAYLAGFQHSNPEKDMTEDDVKQLQATWQDYISKLGKQK